MAKKPKEKEAVDQQEPETENQARDEAGGSEPQPVGHIPVPYPSAEDGMHSVGHIIDSMTGANPLPRNAFIAHAWVAASAALGKVFPPDGPMQATGGEAGAEQTCTVTPEEQETLKEFQQDQPRAMSAASGANPEVGVDWQKWKTLAKIMLEIILRSL